MYPAALLLGATGLAARGMRTLPRWLAMASLGLAFLLLVMAAVGFIGELDALRFLMLPVVLIWVIAASVVLLRAGPPLSAESTP